MRVMTVREYRRTLFTARETCWPDHTPPARAEFHVTVTVPWRHWLPIPRTAWIAQETTWGNALAYYEHLVQLGVKRARLGYLYEP